MSVRQIGTLVRLENNVVHEGKESTLAAFDRSWYKPDAAEKLGQRTRLFASPRCPTGPSRIVAPEREWIRQITDQEVT